MVDPSPIVFEEVVNPALMAIGQGSRQERQFNKLDLTTPVTLAYSASGYMPQTQYIQNYNQGMTMYLYDNNYYNRNYTYSWNTAQSASGAGSRAERVLASGNRFDLAANASNAA